jgi:hypothetical protein
MQNSQIEIEAAGQAQITQIAEFSVALSRIAALCYFDFSILYRIFEPSSPVVSTSLQYLFNTQIGIGPAVMLTMMLAAAWGSARRLGGRSGQGQRHHRHRLHQCASTNPLS